MASTVREVPTAHGLDEPPTKFTRRAPAARAARAAGEPQAVEAHIARDTAVLDSAFRLVHEQYVWRGFMASPHRSGRRVNLRHALPSTRVFVAQLDGRVVGTATLVQDSPLGLPMDEVFGDRLAALRREGRLIAEVSALAMDGDRRAHGIPALMPILRLILLYAAEVSRLDDLCLVVRPQHAKFYEAFFGCRRICEPRDYDKVHLPGAIALRLDLHEVRALIRQIHAGRARANRIQAFLYGADVHAAVLAQLRRETGGPSLTAEQFAEFFVAQDVLAEATPWHRAYVESFYAGAVSRGIPQPDLIAGRPEA